jgi:hypothetical protein
MKTTWEYMSLTTEAGGWVSPKFDAARLEAQLNELGREGWELVGTVATHDQGGKTHALVALFKRPR